MSRRLAAFVAALAFAGLAVSAPPAEAKAPVSTPTVEEILVRARAAEAEAKQRQADLARDPWKEAIEAYRTGKTPLTDYGKLTELVNNSKDEKVQDYRLLAAEALKLRMDNEDLKDPAVRAVRKEIANAVVDLMKAPATDDRGLMAVEAILYAWWRDKVVEYKFKHTDKLKDRTAACTKMKKFLKSEKE